MGSRLITQIKYAVPNANTINAIIISAKKPINPNENPDLLNFYLITGISSNYIEAEGLIEHLIDNIFIQLLIRTLKVLFYSTTVSSYA